MLFTSLASSSVFQKFCFIACLRVTAISFVISAYLDNCEAIKCAKILYRVFIALLTIQTFLIYPQASLQHVKMLKLLFFRTEKLPTYIKKHFSVKSNLGPPVLQAW